MLFVWHGLEADGKKTPTMPDHSSLPAEDVDVTAGVVSGLESAFEGCL
jgi:hypothetical protein